MSQDALHLYAELGARPVINALGHMTMLGGSTPSPAVQSAMQLASRYYVDMDQLLESTGRIIAGLLDCPAALVTPGCAAALYLGTAACMTGKDPEKMARLPETEGLKREVVIQQGQRYKYDRVVRMTGALIAEAGSTEGTTPAQLEEALGPQTLALLYPAHDEREGLVPLRQAIELAHRRGIPVIVDAASRVYPVEGLKKYSAWGADLVGYGAKYIGAPNSTGILCGRADLVEAARFHSFAAFEKHSLPGAGRPLKLDRQEVVGVVAALREWLSMDHQARFAASGRRGQGLRQALEGLPGLTFAPAAGEAPWLRVEFDAQLAGQSAAQVAARLREGQPSIWVGVQERALAFDLGTVWEGDEVVIARQLRAALS
ncbi:MAG: aminotransferase class V-fold PLP-dependent enzyme [Candidatus Latescibacteria bacterium]|nr:aminotransferase class V-fold PLP-dependent enzyme [Candidatus Latescibacterota bacterium]